MAEDTPEAGVPEGSMEEEHSALVALLADKIRRASRDKAWELIGRLFDVLSEAVVVALVERWDAVVDEAYIAVEGALTGVIADHGLHRLPPGENGAQATAEQLRAFTKLLSVALRHRSPPQPSEMMADSISRSIVEALQQVGGKATAAELMAKRPDIAREAMARVLPMLRAAGLTDSVLAGVVPTHRLLLAGDIAWAGRDMQPLHRLAIVPSGDGTELQEWLTKVEHLILLHATKIDHLIGSYLGTVSGYTLRVDRSRTPGQVTFQLDASSSATS